MLKNNSIFKKTALLYMAVLFVILAWGWLVSTPASSQQVDSRINSLEVEVRGLESRLNQIEGQLRGGRFESRGAPSSAPPPSPSNSGRNRSQLSGDPMFDRLATLVIELKQQVNDLEARVSKLESREAPRKTR